MPAKLPSKKQSGKITKSKVPAKKNCRDLLWEGRIETHQLKKDGKINAAESYFDRLIILATDISMDCFNELLRHMSFFYTESYVTPYYSPNPSTGAAKNIDIDRLNMIEDMHKRGVRRFRSLGSQHYELRHLKGLVELYSSMGLSEQVLSTCEDIFRIKCSNCIPNFRVFFSNTLLQMARAGSTTQILSLMEKAVELNPSDTWNDLFFRFLIERIGENGAIGVSLMTSINQLQHEGKLGFLSDADFFALNGRLQDIRGNPNQAILFYLKAIENGLKRSIIFKRCLILLERQHDNDEALRVIQLALKHVSESKYAYSIEEDLLYRRERLLNKTRRVRKKIFVPSFKVKEGNTDIGIILQEKIDNSLTRLVVIESTYSIITLIGMKEPVISAWDVSKGVRIWSTKVPLNLVSKRSTDYSNYYNHGLEANDHCIVYWHAAGKIGGGYSSLLFLSTEGQILSKHTLPDKISEVRISGDIVAVGCRDGHLRAYTFVGELLWDYAFKQSRSVSPTYRECPYHVLAPSDGSRIACISYTQLYTFDRYGNLLWTWQPSRKVTGTNNISITTSSLSDLEQYYSVLDISSGASPDDIKKAFRKKVFETHPDINPAAPKSAEDFRQVYEAYQVLSKGINDSEDMEIAVDIDFDEPNATERPKNGVYSADGSSISIYNFSGSYFRLDTDGKVFEERSIAQFHDFVIRADGTLLATSDNGHAYFYSQMRLITLIPIHCWVQGHFKNEANELLAFWGSFPSLRLTLFKFDGTLLADIDMARPVRSAAFLGNCIIAGTNEELLVLSAGSPKQVSY